MRPHDDLGETGALICIWRTPSSLRNALTRRSGSVFVKPFEWSGWRPSRPPLEELIRKVEASRVRAAIRTAGDCSARRPNAILASARVHHALALWALQDAAGAATCTASGGGSSGCLRTATSDAPLSHLARFARKANSGVPSAPLELARSWRRPSPVLETQLCRMPGAVLLACSLAGHSLARHVGSARRSSSPGSPSVAPRFPEPNHTGVSCTRAEHQLHGACPSRGCRRIRSYSDRRPVAQPHDRLRWHEHQ